MEKTDHYLIVIVPFANLRSKPVDAKPVYTQDDLQVTQVLYNEILLYLDEIDDWYYVEATEQQKYTQKNIWQGYPGWIRKHSVAMINGLMKYNAVVKHKTAHILKSWSEKTGILLTVPIGTMLPIKETANKKYYSVVFANNKRGYISKDDVNRVDMNLGDSQLRKAIISTGKLFLGVPYLWGGRSIYIAELLEEKQIAKSKGPKADDSLFNSRHPIPNAPVAGVDCSGLINLVYRVNNINIPRDAQEQWMAAQKVDCKRLKPGDLIFISAEDVPDSINHVMLNMGRERFIEAADTGSKVKINTFADKFGESFTQLAEHNFFIHNRQIHFGSFYRANEQH
jgi:gamma-D-glutamyl-L-lysine dipeptidyl-peptidase